MNEQLLKRLQDSLKMLSVCLEQLTEVGWLIHDIIEDLELDVSKCNTAVLGIEGKSADQETQTKQDEGGNT